MKPAAIIALTLALVAAGCGGGSSTSPATVATEDTGSTAAVGTASQTQAASSPEDCLSQAGLSNVEPRDTRLWRGNNHDPFFLVVVQSLPTAAKAKEASQQADLVYAYAAGRYLVTGRPRRPTTGASAQTVADCLA